MSTALLFFSQDCFSYLGIFLWYLNFRIVFLILKKKKKPVVKIVLNMQITLGSMDILIILSLLIYEHGISFHLFLPSLIPFINLSQFQCASLSAPWLSLFLSIFLLLILL